MGLADLTRRLDERALPVIAEGIVHCGRVIHRRRRMVFAGALATALLLAVGIWRVSLADLPASQATEARVGVAAGESLPSYASASRQELRSMTRSSPGVEMYALVTLSAYLAPDRVAPVTSGVSVSAVFVRVPLPRSPVRIARIDAFRVPADVLSGMQQLALRREGEVLDMEELLRGLKGGGEAQRRLRASYLTQQQAAAAEAAAYRGGCSCVYALVVRATPEALSDVAGRAGVRMVDLAPEVGRIDRAVFLPPLPEQRGPS
ncbi:hypothetical protein [Pilimelia columellifera]|uniref:Prohibitin n=1 Tax=Pilimelia columellifera subsp. columellifera TaxID=706583 RepID=A0ABP6AJQ7_9ACTN